MVSTDQFHKLPLGFNANALLKFSKQVCAAVTLGCRPVASFVHSFPANTDEQPGTAIA
jgi:hypothetical protein